MKDIVLTLAAVAGVGIAWGGLSTWKKQLHGTNRYKDDGRALRLLFQYKDDIEAVRQAAVDIDNYPEPTPEEKELVDGRETYALVLQRHFKMRLEKLKESGASFDEVLLDVEVSSNRVPKSKVRALHELYFEIKLLAYYYTIWMNPSESINREFRKYSWEILEPKFEVLVPKNLDDEYAKKLHTTISALEIELRDRITGSWLSL